MAPLYPSGLGGNGACWICSKKVLVPGTNCITAVYNFCTGYQNQLLPGTFFVSGSQVQCTIFVPGSQVQGTKFVHRTILIFNENYIEEEFFCSVQYL